MGVEEQRIEWRLPPGAGREMDAPILVACGAFAVMALLMAVVMMMTHWDLRLFLTFALLVVLFVGMIVFVRWAVKRAENARCFVDEAGLHMEPLFRFRWNELKSVTISDWAGSGRRVIRIAARNPLRSRILAFDPASLDQERFLAFVGARLGSAGPVHPAIYPLLWLMPFLLAITLSVVDAMRGFPLAHGLFCSGFAFVSYFAGIGAAIWHRSYLRSDRPRSTYHNLLVALTVSAVVLALVVLAALASDWAGDLLRPAVKYSHFDTWILLGAITGYSMIAAPSLSRRTGTR